MRRKIKWKNVILFIFIFICIGTFSISLFNIIKWKIDSNKTNNQIKEISNTTKIKEIKDNENVEIIENTQEIDEFDPYWDYIKMNLIDVDFNQLKTTNPNVVGWLQVSGTNINYPFVQANDNKFYLSHTFDKSYNEAGWVFLDYRNNPNQLNKNNVIYAHGRLDNSMFGSLRKILKSEWINNKDNYVVKISTENENTLWQVFSVYRIPTTNDYIQIDFYDNNEFLEFGKILLNRSKFNFNTNINENDIILTLSTCFDDFEKVVLHAKLIKREIKQ